MKSKRVSLEDHKHLNQTNTMMKLLREKYNNCKSIKIDFEENLTSIQINTFQNEGNQNECDPQNYFGGENKNTSSNLITPVNFHKSLKIKEFSFSGSSNQTNDETGEKEYPNEIVGLDKNDTSIIENSNGKNFSNTSAKIIPLNKNNFFNLINLKIKNNNEKVEYFTDSKVEIQTIRNLSTPHKDNLDVDILKKEIMGIHAISKLGENVTFNTETCFKNSISSSCDCSICYASESDEFYYSKYTHSSDSNIFNSVKNSDGSEDEFNPKNSERVNKAQLVILNKEVFNLKSPNDYKNFKLIKNNEQIITPSNQTHELLPTYLKNNEKYKTRLMKYLRKPEFSNCKTETRKNFQYRKHSNAFDGNITKYYSNFGMKRRKINSEKKMYETEHAFEDNRANLQKLSSKEKLCAPYFKFYLDKEIGFDSKWQIQLKESEMDDDVETDSEQLQAATRHILREINEGIRGYFKNKKNVRNLVLIKKEELNKLIL